MKAFDKVNIKAFCHFSYKGGQLVLIMTFNTTNMELRVEAYC